MAGGDDDASGSTGGGVSGSHPPVKLHTILVGPSTADEFNKIILPLVPIACFRVDDVRFDFDSSFIASNLTDDQKDIRAELQLLVNLLKKYPQSPLSVFGHADPVGTDDYNKKLSGRRATVIYALLIANSDPESATTLWQGVAAQENWGTQQREAMQSFTGLSAGTADRSVMKAYMQKLLPSELQLGKKDFLGQGADPHGKGDLQGCSEFNPLLIFSQTRSQAFDDASDKQGRNDANARNRRVLVLLFKQGSTLDVKKWPCPSVNEGVAGCRLRFFTGGDGRRSRRLADEDRTFEKTQDTFACRFYQRLLTNSPCEGPVLTVKIRLFDPQGRPLPFAPCLITETGKKAVADRASGAPPSPQGVTSKETVGAKSAVSKDDAYITISVQQIPTTINVRWSRPKSAEGANAPKPNPDDPDDFEYQKDVVIDIPDDDAQASTEARLKNLGYDTHPPILVPGYGNPVFMFQDDYKPQFIDIVADSALNAPTVKAVRTSHDAAETVLRAGGDITITR
jgi:hypothetical protein